MSIINLFSIHAFLLLSTSTYLSTDNIFLSFLSLLAPEEQFEIIIYDRRIRTLDASPEATELTTPPTNSQSLKIKSRRFEEWFLNEKEKKELD